MMEITTQSSTMGGGNMRLPTVSACMPHRNYFQYIEEALISLKLQEHGLKEIVVVDDGSDNGDWERLIKLWETWEHEAVKLTIRRVEKNPAPHRSLRIPYIRNQAFMALTGTPDYVFFPDSDDLWTPDYVKDAIAIMEVDKTIDFVYPNVIMVDDDKSLMRIVEVAEFDLDRLFRQCFCTCCTVMRTDAFLDAGMWPEDQYKKEYVFWNVLARLGHVGKKLKGNYFFYRQHDGQRHMENEKQRHIERGHRYNAERYLVDRFNIKVYA